MAPWRAGQRDAVARVAGDQRPRRVCLRHRRRRLHAAVPRRPDRGAAGAARALPRAGRPRRDAAPRRRRHASVGQRAVRRTRPHPGGQPERVRPRGRPARVDLGRRERAAREARAHVASAQHGARHVRAAQRARGDHAGAAAVLQRPPARGQRRVAARALSGHSGGYAVVSLPRRGVRSRCRGAGRRRPTDPPRARRTAHRPAAPRSGDRGAAVRDGARPRIRLPRSDREPRSLGAAAPAGRRDHGGGLDAGVGRARRDRPGRGPRVRAPAAPRARPAGPSCPARGTGCGARARRRSVRHLAAHARRRRGPAARRGPRGPLGHRRLPLVHRVGAGHDDRARGADAAHRRSGRRGVDPAHLRAARARRPDPELLSRRRRRSRSTTPPTRACGSSTRSHATSG